MKQIKIPLDGGTYRILRIRGAINNRSPEMEAQAILYHVCKQNAEFVASVADKIKNSTPNISDIPQSGDVSSSPNIDQQALHGQEEINHLQGIIHGESGVAVYTYNPVWEDAFFLDKEKRTGYTGDWRLSSYGLNAGQSIVIYKSQLIDESVNNVIYKGYITEIVQRSEPPKRYKIHFKDWKIMGTTRSTWKEFAETGSNPVKYFYGGQD